MSVIIRVNYEGTTYDLDIQEDVPIRLDVSAIENTEIGEFFGVGSQNFTLPGTKNNNKFFKHAYNIGSTDIPAFANTIDGRIITNGQTILKGQFQLLQVVKDEQGYVNYECFMSDETVQFKDSIQNKLIKDADWSDYSHTLGTGSILDSWQNNLLNGKVYYPLADYGIDDPENQGNFPIFGFSNGGTGTWFDNSVSPIKPQQFLPAIRAYDTLERIAAQAGFSVSGDFINSGDFSNLYILPKAQEEMGIVISGSEIPTGYATNNYNQSISIGTGPAIGTKLAANTIVRDPLNKFVVSGSEGFIYYTADGIGEYEASTQIGFFNPVAFSTGTVKVDLKLVKGSFPFSSFVVASTSREFTSADGFNTFTMNVGTSFNSSTSEEVWVLVDYYYTSGTPSNPLNLIGISSKLEITSAPANFAGATVDMALQWPPDLKSIDIVTGLIKQFNLIVYPSPDREKTLVFEHFDDWIRTGNQKDWTDKWNTAQRVSINHTVDEEPAELLFSNADDNDRFSQEAKESEPFYQYGTLRVLADNNISQGKKEIKNTFGPVVLGGPIISGSEKQDGTPTYNIDLGSSFAFPHLYKFESNNQKSYKFKPRLGYKSNNSIPSGSSLVIGNSFDDNTRISGSYGTLSNINGLPALDNARDLHFNNTYFKFAGPGLNLSNSNDNFNAYWRTYIDGLYWDGNRKVTLDILFSADEYKDIELNDIIFIKDQQYRINKISGLNVVSDDVVEVELIRLFPAYYQNNPDCDFRVSATQLDCDFTFEAAPGLTPGPTPAPTPIVGGTFNIEGWRLSISGTGTGSLTYLCPVTNQVIDYEVTESYSSGDNIEFTTSGSYTPTFSTSSGNYSFTMTGPVVTDTVTPVIDYTQQRFYHNMSTTYDGNILPPFQSTESCDWRCSDINNVAAAGDGFGTVSGSLLWAWGMGDHDKRSGSFSCPGVTPTPTPTAGPGPVTPTPTPTLPPGQTPTPTPSPTPQVFSYTGLANYSSYNDACSGSTEVTIYTRGEIGTGSVAYEDSSLTNVFDFYKFFIDENTGVGYEFVDPNTTGVVIDTLDDACNVEVFRLYIDFNEYDACTEAVIKTVYAEPGDTITNGTTLYEDINLQYTWSGTPETKFIVSGSSPKQIYYNTETGVSQSGTDVCFSVNSFNGWDSTASTPPAAVCGDYDEVFYVQDTPQVGDNIFTDANLTDPIFTGEKFVYNDDANELYVMSGSTGGDGTGWVIGEITSSYCSPATPTPSPTPAPIVTLMNVSASYTSFEQACTNAAFTGSIYHTQVWDGTEYVEYFYEDANQNTIFDFYIYVIDTATDIGYEMDDPNTTGRIFATQSSACTPNEVTIHYSFNEYDACAGTLSTTKYIQPGKSWGDSGVIMYNDFDRTSVFSTLANEYVSTSSLDRSIYEYDGGVLVDTGVDCYTSSFFNGSDYTATAAPSPQCGIYEKTLYTQNAPQIGSVIYTDQDFTDPIFTGNNWVYNDSANELYHMSGSTGGDGTGWVIGEITSSVCTPPPTPTPTPNVQSYVMQRGYDAASQTCGTSYGQITVYTNGNITTGSIMYEDSGLTTNVDFYGYYRDINTDIVYEASTLTGEVFDVLGTSICATPTPTPSPTPQPTPTPTPTPAPSQWWSIEFYECPNYTTAYYRNWYGDINQFDGNAVYYDSNLGLCLEPFYIVSYNSGYTTLDESEVYTNCTTCLAG